jgi:glycerol-3-phosphate dehydrogenase
MNSIPYYETIIVGGGIVGAGIFRDLSLHEHSVLIIDKDDFGSKTSQASSKMLHGGIRYLENLDFSLVYEALHEKNLWLKIAPDFTYEERFHLPVFNDSKRPLWQIKIGLLFYDLLSGLKNTPHKLLLKNELLKTIENLKETNLSGAGVYSDAVVDDYKLNLELIYDGLTHLNSYALSYHEFKNIEKKGQNFQVHVYDKIKKAPKVFNCKNIIYATGPYTDKLLKEIIPNWKDVLLPSKGSHLWLKNDKLKLKRPIVITTKDDRVIFIIPQNNMVLVGTTELQELKLPDTLKISDFEINYLLNELNSYFPNISLNRDDILGSFCGIRPLAKDENESLKKTSREHRIIQNGENSFIIFGGKYTTFRTMGQLISKIIITRTSKSYYDQLSMTPIVRKSICPSFASTCPSTEELKLILEYEFPKTINDLVERRIGINSKKMWNYKFNIKYDDYFTENKKLIENYFSFNISDPLTGDI